MGSYRGDVLRRTGVRSTRRCRSFVIFLFAAIVGLVFGASVQYLGSMSWLGAWTATAAQMSAPWLILPFVFGITQQRRLRSAALGLSVTFSALLGYWAMTYSPMEIHPWTFGRFTSGMVAVTTRGWFNPVVILAGLVMGPLFGLLGQRWRVGRSWVSAAIVAGALCLEPLARLAAGQLMPSAPVWTVEVTSGTVVGALFVYAVLGSRRASRLSP